MATNEQFNQLYQYFEFLTETHLVEQFGMDTGKILSDRFKKLFNEHFSTNKGLMPDLISKQHGINSTFIMALDDTLKTQNLSREDLKINVLSIYQTMLKDLLQKQANQLESSENPWQSFVEMAKVGNQQLYENDFFQLKTIHEDASKFGFDICKCLYFDIFKENNKAELGSILCEYDYIIASNNKNLAEFQRFDTIAKGDSCCTFRFYRVSKSER